MDHDNTPNQPPPPLDTTQPPQLNATICQHAWGCECGQNIGEGSEDAYHPSASIGRQWQMINEHATHRTIPNTRSESDTDSIQGDEGVESSASPLEDPPHISRQIRVQSHTNLDSLFALLRALNQHDEEPSPSNWLVVEYEYDSDSPTWQSVWGSPSPMWRSPTDSLFVNVGSRSTSSGESSLCPSSRSFSRVASTPNLLLNMGAGLEAHFLPLYHFSGSPLSLSVECLYPTDFGGSGKEGE